MVDGSRIKRVMMRDSGRIPKLVRILVTLQAHHGGYAVGVTVMRPMTDRILVTLEAHLQP